MKPSYCQIIFIATYSSYICIFEAGHVFCKKMLSLPGNPVLSALGQNYSSVDLRGHNSDLGSEGGKKALKMPVDWLFSELFV